MKINRLFLKVALLLGLSLGVMSCSDNEDPITKKEEEAKNTTAELSSNNCEAILHGHYERGTQLTEDHYFSVPVNVTKTGTYYFETEESNGYQFVADGQFTETGEQEMIYQAVGIPEVAGEDYFVLNFANATCGRNVMVYETGYPNPDSTVIIVSGEATYSDKYYVYARNGAGEALWKREGLSPVPVFKGDMVYLMLNDEIHAVDINNGETIWNTNFGENFYQDALTADENNIYLSGSGFIISVSIEDGSVNWRYSIGTAGNIPNTPSVAGGKVYVGYQKSLYCIDQNGNLVWEYPMTMNIGETLRSNVAVVNGVVYVGNDSGYLYALDAADTSEIWSYNVQLRGSEAPTIYEEKVYLQGENKLYCLNALTGDSLWTYEPESETEWSSPTVVDGVVYTSGLIYGFLALDAATGEVLWENEGSEGISPTVLGSLLVGGGSNGLSSLNAVTGEHLWGFGALDPWHSENSVHVYRSAAIYNRMTGEVAYPSISGHKH